MSKLYYLRFYSHSRNYHERFLWTAQHREAVEEMAEDYEKETSFRLETIRFICNTQDYVADSI